MRAYDQSQMRLGMNRIDLLVIHDLDFWFHQTEAKVSAHLAQLFTSGWRALEQLRAHGLVKAVGAGINELGMIPRFLDMLDIDFFPGCAALHASGAGNPGDGTSLLRASERRDCHWRCLQFRHHRDRRGQGRQIQLPGRATGNHGDGSARSRRCARRMACRWPRRRFNSRLGTHAWQRSSPERSIRIRCARTSRLSATQFPRTCGPT